MKGEGTNVITAGVRPAASSIPSSMMSSLRAWRACICDESSVGMREMSGGSGMRRMSGGGADEREWGVRGLLCGLFL